MLKKKVRLLIGCLTYVALLTGYSGVASAAAASSNVTFCHATGKANTYQQLSASPSAVISGHSKHAGDIIPPFTYLNKGVSTNFPGLNWTLQGQATFNNGCVFIAVGGSGGGTTGQGSVLGAATSSTDPNQVTQPQQGAVSAGEGGGSVAYSPVSITGMIGSLVALAGGTAWLNFRKQAGVR